MGVRDGRTYDEYHELSLPSKRRACSASPSSSSLAIISSPSAHGSDLDTSFSNRRSFDGIVP